jgi:hypothetical protein
MKCGVPFKAHQGIEAAVLDGEIKYFFSLLFRSEGKSFPIRISFSIPPHTAHSVQAAK